VSYIYIKKPKIRYRESCLRKTQNRRFKCCSTYQWSPTSRKEE